MAGERLPAWFSLRRTLIVRGDDDHLVSRQSAFELAEAIEGAHLASIPFCGHEVHKVRPRMLIEMIHGFLS